MTDKVEYRLGFGGYIDPAEANSLRGRICEILERPDFGSLVIMFSSEGAGTDESITLFNFLIQLPVPVRMHAVGHVGSASIPVFLAGGRRTISPIARFFFHEYDWGFTGRQTLNRIDEAIKRLRSDIDLARQIIKARTKAPPEILQTLDGRSPSAIVSPEEAKALGLVEEVGDLSDSGDSGMRVVVWTAAAARRTRLPQI